MKTLTKITCVHYRKNGGVYEATYSFIRPRSAKKPTFPGAARMVARLFNDAKNERDPELITKPSDISVSRIEEMVFAR